MNESADLPSAALNTEWQIRNIESQVGSVGTAYVGRPSAACQTKFSSGSGDEV